MSPPASGAKPVLWRARIRTISKSGVISAVCMISRREYPRPRRWHLSIACNHCDDPQCVSHCPTTAMHKREEDGVVLVDHDKCVGCRYCTWACPYEAPQFDPAIGMMTKCDTCLDLREQGGNPMCVDSCPMRAIEFGLISELRKNTAPMPISAACQAHPLPGRTWLSAPKDKENYHA